MNVFFFKLHLKHGVGVEGDTLQENGKASKFTYILTLKHNTVQCWIENTGKIPVKNQHHLTQHFGPYFSWSLLILKWVVSLCTFSYHFAVHSHKLVDPCPLSGLSQ